MGLCGKREIKGLSGYQENQTESDAMMMKCLHCKWLIITHYFAGAEKLKIQRKSSDLHVFMENGCEICADEDLIEEIINGQLLILAEQFEDHFEWRDSCMNDCEG